MIVDKLDDRNFKTSTNKNTSRNNNGQWHILHTSQNLDHYTKSN